MEEKENLLKDSVYLTYNSLNKPALFAGVPLMMMVFLIGTFFFICFPLYMFFGKVVGSIPTAFLVIVYVITKISSENDPNAIKVILLKMKGFLQFKLKKILGVRG